MKTNSIIQFLQSFKKSNAEHELQQLRFAIYETYFELLLAFARKYFDEITAEQILFDFFEKRMIANYLLRYPDLDKNSFDKFLFASFRNFCYSAIEKQQRQKKWANNYSDQVIKDAKPSIFEDNLHIVIKDYLGPLKLEHKTVILLRAVNFSFQEIATIMGVTEKAAKSKLTRARDNVREHLSSNRPFKYKDLSKLQDLMSMVQESDIKDFLEALAYSDRDLGEIFETIGESGLDTNNLIQRSIGYIRKYYQRAA